MGMNFNLDGTTDAWAEHKRKQMEAAKKADMEKKKEEESSYNEDIWNTKKQKPVQSLIPSPDFQPTEQVQQPAKSVQKTVTQQKPVTPPVKKTPVQPVQKSVAQQSVQKTTQAVTQPKPQVQPTAKPVQKTVAKPEPKQTVKLAEPVQNVDDNIEEDEVIKLVKISARINEKVDEVMKDMAQEFGVPFSQVVRLAIDGHLEKYLGTVRYIDGDQGENIQRTMAIIANELQGIRNELNKVGVNVNQVAKWNNLERQIERLNAEYKTATPVRKKEIQERLMYLTRVQKSVNWNYFSLFAVEKYLDRFDAVAERVGEQLWHTQE